MSLKLWCDRLMKIRWREYYSQCVVGQESCYNDEIRETNVAILGRKLLNSG